MNKNEFKTYIEAFDQFESKTRMEYLNLPIRVPKYINEYWSSSPTPTNKIHQVSYRACFKSHLPKFFIDLLSKPGDLVYDPFMGRGTTLIQAVLTGRKAGGNDINPVSHIYTCSRLLPVEQAEVEHYLDSLQKIADEVCPDYRKHTGMEAFYHPETLIQILNLMEILFGEHNAIDSKLGLWVAMVAMTRLSGDGANYFSGYTMPAGASVTLKAQQRINNTNNARPFYRDIFSIIREKSAALLSEISGSDRINLLGMGVPSLDRVTLGSSDNIELQPGRTDLVVTSPPFLDAVDYKTDNWLRGWFCQVDTKALPIWQSGKLDEWNQNMLAVMKKLSLGLRQGGYICFEVGDVQKGKVKLDESVMRIAGLIGLTPVCVVENSQDFAKVSQTYGVRNNEDGTNSNKICVLQK